MSENNNTDRQQANEGPVLSDKQNGTQEQTFTQSATPLPQQPMTGATNNTVKKGKNKTIWLALLLSYLL